MCSLLCLSGVLNVFCKRTLKDAAELDQLISYLINKEDSEGVVLVGHSTGCQVSVIPIEVFRLIKMLNSIYRLF